jgi:hypothetical protein
MRKMSARIAGNDRDRFEPAFRAAGGICQSLKLALRPGKPLAKGRGGSARLLPLVVVDGFAEIGSGIGDVHPDDVLRFDPFVTSFML